MVAGASGTRTSRRSLRPVPVPLLIAACFAVALGSLLIPTAMGFDPWAWIVWGREVGHLELDTSGGPSWKPLPVMITAVLSVLGDAAPSGWLVIARGAGLLLVLATYRLASRFAGWPAGVVAVALLVLAPDGEPRLIRTVAEAHGAPMDAALAMWAIDRHLERRFAHTLLLGTALALMRPEVWPILGLYGLWLWRQHPRLRVPVVVAAASIPVLWFGGDWWGSGDPWHGAEAAQVASGGAWDRFVDAIGRAADIVVVPAWVAAGAAVAIAVRERDRVLPALSVVAAMWCAVVVAMAAVLRYAALSRFLLPAAAIVCVLAGVGAVRLPAAAPRGLPRTALVAVALLAATPFVAQRALRLDDVVAEVRARARLSAGLADAIEQAGGAERVLACGTVAVDGASLLLPAVAWELDVPIERVRTVPEAGPAVLLVIAGGHHDVSLTDPSSPVRAVPMARSDVWAVHAVDCPAVTGPPSPQATRAG